MNLKKLRDLEKQSIEFVKFLNKPSKKSKRQVLSEAKEKFDKEYEKQKKDA